MNTKKTSVFILCFLICIHVIGQEKITNAVSKYIEKSKTNLLKNQDSALIYSEKALVLAQQTTVDTLIAKAQIQKSSIFLLKNEFHKADSILSKELKKKLPAHIEGQIWHNLGSIEYRKFNLDKALELYLKAIKTTEKSNQQKLLLNSYTNIGVIHAQLKNYNKAQEYLEKAVVLAKNNEPLKLQVLTNLANIYKENKAFSKFEAAILESEKLAKKYNISKVLAVIYSNLSNYYTNEKPNYNKALFYGKQSVFFKKKSPNKDNLSLTYNNIAHTYLSFKKYKKAITYLDSALPNSKGLLKSYIYNNYKNAYAGLKNYKNAAYYAELKDVIKDSVHNEQQKEKITEITEKYESEKKEQKIAFLNSKNELQKHKISNQKKLFIVGLLIVLLLTLLAFLWYKNKKTNQELQQASMKHKLLQTQLNPHFLFHSLNNIQSYVYDNKKEESITYLSSYSKLMRSIFENATSDFITIEEDLETMKSYLNLQRVNFSSDVNFSLNADNTILEYLIPPMFIQPYIENAIQHGIKNIKNGEVSVNYKDNNNSIIVSVFDNGNGLKLKNNNQLLERNSSTKVIKERIQNLQKSHNYFIKEQVESKHNKTLVTLIFPKKTLL